jgi:DNA-binding response OmpR family regulator
VTDVLIASDATWFQDEIRSMLTAAGTTVRAVRAGVEVLPAILDELPDLVILDLQIGNMGGMATCLDIRLEEGAGRVGHVPVLMLLDRRADVFLARRSDAQGWLLKPLDAIRLRRATAALVAGGTYFDDSYLPHPVRVAPRSDTISSTGK